MRWTRIFATAACVAGVIVALRFYPSKPHPDANAAVTAEDQVYEAVVREMVAPMREQHRVSQLVFDDRLMTNALNGTEPNSCRQRARDSLRLGSNTPPPYNSLADKIYRYVTSGADVADVELRADTVDDFVEKSCIAGRLPQTFHTDLPRTFIPSRSVHFAGWIFQKDGSKSFEQLFPGARGIISLSPVGFDERMDQAIVSTSYVCGGVCGNGSVYVLTKRWGRWEVAKQWGRWTS